MSLTLIPGCASQPASPSAAARNPAVHVYRTTEGRTLGAHVFSPFRRGSATTPAIVLFHGGGWSAGAPDWVYVSARRFAQMGLLAVAVEYRLSDGKVVPNGCWFAAETAPGVEYALVGCAVAPGFEYGDFELGDREVLLAAHPRHQELVLRFT